MSAATRAMPSAPRPGRGLVEEQQARAGGEGDADLERAAVAVGKALRAHAFLAGEAHVGERAHRARLRVRPGAAASRNGSWARARNSGVATIAFSSADVVVEQVHDLEGARDAAPRDGARRQPGDVLAREGDAPGVGLVAAGEHVEAGGLAGAVGTHDPVDLALVHLEAHVLEHHAVAEPLREPLGGEERLATHRRPSPKGRRRRCHIPAIPSGLNSTIAMKRSPYQSSHVSV